MFRTIKFKTQLIAGNTIVLAVIGVVGIVVYFSVNTLIEDSKWVEHTHKVLNTGNSLVGEMINMETGMRGFLIGGEEHFLDPYNLGGEIFLKRMAEAKGLVSDNPKQVARLEEIGKLAKQWDEKAAKFQIATRMKANVGAKATAYFKEVQSRTVGKQIFDNTRAVITGMEAKFIRGRNLAGQLLMKNILLDLVNMETGQRGFLLTGLEESLDPYKRGQVDFVKDMGRLTIMITKGKGSGITNKDVEQLLSLVRQWRNKAADLEINARREVNKFSVTMDDVAALVEKGAGKEFMDKLRSKVQEFLDIEKQLLAVRAKEAGDTAKMAMVTVFVGFFLAIVLGIFVVFLLLQIVANQLGGEPAEVAHIAKEIANGNLALNFDENTHKKGLFDSMTVMIKNLRKIVVQVRSAADNVSSSSDDLNAIASKISLASDSTVERSNSVASAAEEMNMNMNSVASAMEQASGNINTVAAASEQMNVNISDIVKNMDAARESTDSAVVSADEVLINVTTLGQDANEIGTVTETIAAISDKTNLLALNATIEAARAGEAGKGFAVVANEIKELANQTATATTDIGKKLKGIQSSAGIAVTGVQKIAEIIKSLNKIVMSVGKTVTQQKNATQEISENISQASLGIKEISENVSQTSKAANQITSEITKVNESAKEMSDSMVQLNQSAEELSKMAALLKDQIGQFKV